MENKKVKVKNNNNSSLKNTGSTIAKIVIVALVILSGLFLIILGFMKTDKNNITFNESGEADYKVFLKQNDYYSEPFISKSEHMSFIASLIDYIHIDFSYKLTSSNESQINTKYTVDAKLLITERGEDSKVLYVMPVKLKDETVKNVKTNNEIYESVDIKYDEYNAIVNKYKREYALSVSSKLLVTMHIDSTANSDKMEGSAFTSQNDLVLSIPLSEQTLNINFDYNSINNSKQFVEYGSLNTNNYIYIATGVVLIIISVVYVVFLKERKEHANETGYTKLKNNILKQYDRYIVETSDIKTDFGDKNIITVKSFTELLDARDNVDKPILFHEDKDARVSRFILIDEKCVYEYTIKESNIK